MLRFLGHRLSSALLTLAIAAVAVFLVARMIPGDPVMIMLGEATGMPTDLGMRSFTLMERVFSKLDIPKA